jgi:hypothetical protein
MKLIKVRGLNPKTIYAKALKAIDNEATRQQFDMFVKTAVNMEAKNTSNHNSRDLAAVQVIQLAHDCGIIVEVV